MSDSFVTPWTVAYKAPLSIGFPRQEYWKGLPFPSPGDLPKWGIKSTSPASAWGFFTTESPGKPYIQRKPLLNFVSYFLLNIMYTHTHPYRSILRPFFFFFQFSNILWPFFMTTWKISLWHWLDCEYIAEF